MEKYYLSKQLIQDIGNYLVSKPFAEVATLVRKIEMELAEQEEKKQDVNK
jgi:hypothetical protein